MQITLEPSLLNQWKRLILPPYSSEFTGGEQLDTGNRYPNAERLDLFAHVEGLHTYAVDIIGRNPEGKPFVRCGVLDIDDIDGLDTAKEIYKRAQSNGLAAALEFSGRKGFHVWIFSEPVPKETMVAVLKKLKAEFPHSGELIPGDNIRVKLPPAWHKEGNGWAYFFYLDDTPQKLGTLSNKIEFQEAQAQLLADIKPTPANVLFRFIEDVQKPHIDSEQLIPKLHVLNGALPPCMDSFLKRGGSPDLGTWDKNALTLARYVKSAGISQVEGHKLAVQLAKDTADDLQTTKSYEDKLRHWHSIQNTPSLQEPFSCTYMLAGRKSLGFSCTSCPAKPAGIHTDKKTSNPLNIEKALADKCIAYALKHGHPAQRINSSIFPAIPVTGGRILFKLHSLIWDFMQEGPINAATVPGYIDHSSWKKLISYDESQQLIKFVPAQQSLFKKQLNDIASSLLFQLESLPEMGDAEKEALFKRGADFSNKLQLHEALSKTQLSLENPACSITQTIQAVQEDIAGFQKDLHEELDHTLGDYAEELLQGLIAQDRAVIATPFSHLNKLMGGGFQGGKMYVLAGPPGAGKTTLAACLADYAVSQGQHVCFVPFEMGRNQLFDYALSRKSGINSAIIESKSYRNYPETVERITQAAYSYLKEAGHRLTILEGDYFTTAAKLSTWAAVTRAKNNLSADAPLLIVVDYLQLMNSGIESIDTMPSETPRISEVAVQLKRLARQTKCAVLALSDITKECLKDYETGKDLGLGALKGSARIGHAADCVLYVYSDPGREYGGMTPANAWDLYAAKFKDGKALMFNRELEENKRQVLANHKAAAVCARIHLAKMRGGEGKGSQLLVYERAFHRFIEAKFPNQLKAEGKE